MFSRIPFSHRYHKREPVKQPLKASPFQSPLLGHCYPHSKISQGQKLVGTEDWLAMSYEHRQAILEKSHTLSLLTPVPGDKRSTCFHCRLNLQFPESHKHRCMGLAYFAFLHSLIAFSFILHNRVSLYGKTMCSSIRLLMGIRIVSSVELL